MKIMALILTVSLSAFAQYSGSSSSSSSGSYSRGGGSHAFSAAIGFYSPGGAFYSKANPNASISPAVSGLFGIGGDYEYVLNSDMTIGAIFRYYSSSDTVYTGANNGAEEEKASAWTVSAIAKAYMPTDNFLPYVGTGFGILGASVKRGSTEVDPSATIGLPLVMGVLYKLTDNMSFGVENLRIWALGEKINGQPVNDFMFKARFVF